MLYFCAGSRSSGIARTRMDSKCILRFRDSLQCGKSTVAHFSFRIFPFFPRLPAVRLWYYGSRTDEDDEKTRKSAKRKGRFLSTL